MSRFSSRISGFTALFQDPPPELVFEVSEEGVSLARTRSAAGIVFESLPPGTISASPLRDNVLAPDVFAAAVSSLAGGTARKRRQAALILPDYCARVSVLDFDSFPEKHEEQEALVRFRIKKSVPFDVESAAVSFWRQSGADGKSHDVVVAVMPHELLARYEAPFRAMNLHPGLVTTSSLACLDLVTQDGISVVAKINGHVLTVMVVNGGMLKLIRSLELTEFSISEIAADLYPTFVYVEDHLKAEPSRILLSGFGSLQEEARGQFHAELNLTVEPLLSPFAAVNAHNAGLLGYLQSLAAPQANRQVVAA